MSQLIGAELRREAQKLIRDGKVSVVVGYGRGATPSTASTLFIRTEEDAEKLVFDRTCGVNLAIYLRRLLPELEEGERVGVVAKGCDSRTVLELAAEGQIDRDRVLIIGVPCNGMLSPQKLEERSGPKSLTELVPSESSILLRGRGLDLDVPVDEVLCDCCLECAYPNPDAADTFVGERVEPRTSTSSVLDGHEERDPDQKWKLFRDEIEKCIRCYACRDACPLCYCEECFVDRTDPLWFGKSIDPDDTACFHLTRIIDLAGRCVLCGACERACPTGVDLMPLKVRVTKEILDRYGFTSGLDSEVPPPMASYSEQDEQEFIL